MLKLLRVLLATDWSMFCSHVKDGPSAKSLRFLTSVVLPLSSFHEWLGLSVKTAVNTWASLTGLAASATRALNHQQAKFLQQLERLLAMFVDDLEYSKARAQWHLKRFVFVASIDVGKWSQVSIRPARAKPLGTHEKGCQEPLHYHGVKNRLHASHTGVVVTMSKSVGS